MVKVILFVLLISLAGCERGSAKREYMDKHRTSKPVNIDSIIEQRLKEAK